MVAAMVMKRGIVAGLLGAAVAVHAPASVADTEAEPWSNVPYLVVGSFKSYAGATKHVTMLEARTGISVDLRNLVFKKGVLSLEDEECEHNGMAGAGAECWVPRGRQYNGIAFSIERSDWYPPMKPGYYVVVAMTGAGDELTEARATLSRAGVNSYVTYVPTYEGCTR
jgi:hypothetical protein